MGNRKMKINFKTDVQKERTITIEEFLQLHSYFLKEKNLEGLAERTLKEYENNLNYFKKWLELEYQSNYDCVAVDADIFKKYLYYMQNDKEYNPFTINIRLRTMKTYLKWLHTESYISSDINLKVKKVKVPQDFTSPLNENDIKKLLGGCDISTYSGFRDYCTIITILDCGIRIHELCSLKIKDVDVKQGLIKIDAKTTKTRTARLLPISNKTCKLLKQLIDVAGETECDNVFQSTYGGNIKPNNISLSLNRIKSKVGIHKSCTPYVLRHTFATNAVKSGIDMFTLQRIMGHSTILTTRKYVQLETEDLKKKHERLNPVDKFF
jgi:integrase/recombinase XerD